MLKILSHSCFSSYKVKYIEALISMNLNRARFYEVKKSLHMCINQTCINLSSCLCLHYRVCLCWGYDRNHFSSWCLWCDFIWHFWRSGNAFTKIKLTNLNKLFNTLCPGYLYIKVVNESWKIWKTNSSPSLPIYSQLVMFRGNFCMSMNIMQYSDECLFIFSHDTD